VTAHGLASGVETLTPSTVEDAAAPPADAAVTPTDDVAAVLQLLRDKGLVDLSNPDTAAAIIRAVLEVAGGGAVLIQPKAGEPPPLALRDAAAGIQGPLPLTGSLLLVQVFNVDAVPLDEFRRRIAACDRTGTAGLVVDLRAATGEMTEQAPALDAAFAGFELPTVILVSRNTEGVGELLARQLRARPLVAAIGERTSGQAFNRDRFPLASGAVVLFPRAFAEPLRAFWPPRALVPDIPMRESLPLAALQTPVSEADLPDRLSHDPVLRRAADLLTVVHGLQPPPP